MLLPINGRADSYYERTQKHTEFIRAPHNVWWNLNLSRGLCARAAKNKTLAQRCVNGPTTTTTTTTKLINYLFTTERSMCKFAVAVARLKDMFENIARVRNREISFSNNLLNRSR